MNSVNNDGGCCSCFSWLWGSSDKTGTEREPLNGHERREHTPPVERVATPHNTPTKPNTVSPTVVQQDTTSWE